MLKKVDRARLISSVTMASPGGGPKLLNVPKLRARIANVIEQPAFDVEGGGLASTDPSSYANARALLVLAAFQLFPYIVKRMPEEFQIVSLNEAHPADAVTGVSSVRIRWEHSASSSATSSTSGGGGGGGSGSAATSKATVWIPVRSQQNNRLLQPSDVRRHGFRALGLCSGLSAGAALDAWIAECEEEFHTKYKAAVPTDVVHLIRMGVMPHNYVAEYDAAVGAGRGGGSDTAAAASSGSATTATGGAVAAATSPTKGASRGAAMTLWWPPPATAVTFAEAMAAHREAVAVRAVVEAEAREADREDKRSRAAAAAMARFAGGGGGGGTGGKPATG